MEVGSMDVENIEIKNIATKIIIEEISKGHKLLHRHKLSKEQIHIGRDYHNDIILSDPHICPSHVSIEFINGHWHITDHQTVNGTFVENPKQKKHDANQHILHDGDIISLGKSQLRILFCDHKMAPTVAFSPFEGFIDLMRHPVSLFLSITLFTLIAGGIFYLNKPVEVNFSQLFVPAMSMALGFALWPAGVSLISHLSKHDARVMTQLGVCFALFNLMWFSDVLESIAAFNSASNSILPLLVMLISVGLAFFLFWLNSYIGFHMSARRRIIVAASITTLLFGGSYLVNYSNKPEFNPRPQYDATIMMPNFLLAPSSSVDEFIEDSSKLFNKTRIEALKE
jgi:hypothetical protein